MATHVRFTEIILYVADQERSRDFYEHILRSKPHLHVPGMTEFKLSEQCKLGLMPEAGIAKILAGKTPDPGAGNGIPRCELYLYVDNVEEEYDNALKYAKVIQPPMDMDWGDRVCYFADPDGHIVAFAQQL